MSGDPEGSKEACKTYIEQTKLLVALASAFVVAPAALIPLLKNQGVTLTESVLCFFLWAEILFVASVLLGYLVLGSIAGYQHKGKYNIYRPSTLYISRTQVIAYLAGLILFVAFIRSLLNQLT